LTLLHAASSTQNDSKAMDRSDMLKLLEQRGLA